MRLYPTTWNKIDSDSPAKALDLGLSLSLTKLILSRLKPGESIESLLHPPIRTSPMSGELEAAKRIMSALKNHERIGIFGDYDVDGVTSSALLTRLFRHHGLEPRVFIPSRYEEGYGLNPKSVHLVTEVDLLITVDCGITSVEEVAQLKAKGIEVIITDHHEPKAVLPDTIVMNPKLADYPFRQLAGVGVAYKLALRLDALGLCLPGGLIELATLGTVADVMPLIDENRAIVMSGLKALEQTEVEGLRLLLAEQKLDKVRATDLAFRIGPLLNAAGRMDSPLPAYELLVESDPMKLKEIIAHLIQQNNDRKLAQDKIMHELEKRLTQVPPIIIEKGSDWLGGVLGLAASKIADKYRRPVILLEEGNTLKGSGRSVGQFSLLSALEAAEKRLTRFGGHQQAAGLELLPEHFFEFYQAMQTYTASVLTEDDTTKSYDYHPIELGEIHLEFLDQLELMEPFGVGNPGPIFRLDSMVLQSMRLMGKNQTSAALEFKLCDRVLRVVTFSIVPEDWTIGRSYDVLFRLERNTFQGVTQLQLMLVDARESVWRLTPSSPAFDFEADRLWNLVESYDSDVDQIGSLSLLVAVERGEAPASVLGNLGQSNQQDVAEFVAHLPKRSDLVASYKQLKAAGETLDLRLQEDPLRMFIQVKLFEQLGLLTYTKNDFLIKLVWQDKDKRFDLDDAHFYRQSQKILEDFHELDRLDSRY